MNNDGDVHFLDALQQQPQDYPRVVKLAQELIRIPSITPNDFGCQALVRNHLQPLGFECETMQFHDVTNLWCVLDGSKVSSSRSVPKNGDNIDDGNRLIVFVGHTDVVPPGSVEEWTYPPFDGTITTTSDGQEVRGEDATQNDSTCTLYGRGAVDMKGGVAAFVSALECFLSKHKYTEMNGSSVGILLTSDEEGDAKYGTKEVLNELVRNRDMQISMAIVGEPSGLQKIGDVIKVGRRGSLSGDLTLHGIQGHVAYPHLARNPIHESLGALKDMVDEVWDHGTNDFPPTTFQISNIASGTGALNVIPGFKKVHFNFRYSPASTYAQLQERVEQILKKHALQYTLIWDDDPSLSLPYETRDVDNSELIESTIQAVNDVMGYTPRLCTSGGTSDGRFVAQITNPKAPKAPQIVELGLINKTIHKVDEHVPIQDLVHLTEIYEKLLERLLLSKLNKDEKHEDNHPHHHDVEYIEK